MSDTPATPKGAHRSDIATVMEHHGLTDAGEIRFLTDRQLIFTPGIGRGKFDRLRVSFPLAPGVQKAVEALEEEKRMLSGNQLIRIIEERSGRTIELGEINGVTAVQFIDRMLVIACSVAPWVRVIDILWDIDTPDQARQPRGCFGHPIDPETYRHVHAFPSFFGVTSVEVLPGNEFRDFRTLKVQISSKLGIFTFQLFMRNDGECPTGREEEGRHYSSSSFCLELRSDPKIKETLQRAFRGLEMSSQALFLGKVSAALKAYLSVQEDVARILAEAGKLAEVRDLNIRPEAFGLTQTDTRCSAALQDGIPAEEIFTRHDEFPCNVSPLSLAGDIMRHVLERGEDELARRIVGSIVDASAWMNDTQRAQIRHCLTILDEFATIRDSISKAGIAGVTRKSIIEGVNGRQGTDGGMARRAVLRWLDGDHQQFIKISAPKGVLYRTRPDEGKA